LGLLRLFEDLFLKAQAQEPASFPDFRAADTMLVVSDYGGEHNSAKVHGYSFLLLTPPMWAEWEPRRLALREELRFDRRVSFKRLSDRRRRRAMPFFLDAAGQLSGLSFTCLVSKEIESLFERSGPVDRAPDHLRPMAGWKTSSVEKLLRITHLLALLIAGLSSPGQNVYWFSDRDEIVANEGRLRSTSDVLASAVAALVPHDMGNLRCGTANSDNGRLQLEDLIAIPDLVVGSACEFFSKDPVLSSVVVTPAPGSLSAKSRSLLAWFADPALPLCRIVVLVEPVPGSTALGVRRIRFHGQDEPAV
jgi:hypothetical protein